MLSKKQLFIIVALVFHFWAAPYASALAVTDLIIFGDSNVDIGRVASDLIPNDGELPPPNTVGFRASDGLILTEYLAERVGVTRQTIIAIEQGRYSPSLETAFDIAGVFGVPLDEVFQYSGSS